MPMKINISRGDKAKAEAAIRDIAKKLPGMVLAIVWAVPYAGLERGNDGMLIMQTQYGMKAYSFRAEFHAEHNKGVQIGRHKAPLMSR